MMRLFAHELVALAHVNAASSIEDALRPQRDTLVPDLEREACAFVHESLA
jgi:hypothetical protein